MNNSQNNINKNTIVIVTTEEDLFNLILSNKKMHSVHGQIRVSCEMAATSPF
jgi:hypothetical protein